MRRLLTLLSVTELEAVGFGMRVCCVVLCVTVTSYTRIACTSTTRSIIKPISSITEIAFTGRAALPKIFHKYLVLLLFLVAHVPCIYLFDFFYVRLVH
jgi:hypothetical protein